MNEILFYLWLVSVPVVLFVYIANWLYDRKMNKGKDSK